MCETLTQSCWHFTLFCTAGVMRCMLIEINGTRQRVCLKKTWLDHITKDMRSFRLSPDDGQVRNRYSEKENSSKDNWLNLIYLENRC